MTGFTATAEYQQRREKDEKEERGMRDMLSKIYEVHGLHPSYNTEENSGKTGKAARFYVVDREKRGCDVELETKDGRHFIVDEKSYMSNADAFHKSKTYAFEVSSQNNKDGNGWLFKEDALNTHFALIYPELNEQRELQKVEILLLRRDVLLDALKESGIGDRKSAEEYLEKRGSWGDDNRKRARVNDYIRIVHTGEAVLSEQPTNIVIDRAWLKQKSEFVITETDMSQVQQKYESLQKQKTLTPKAVIEQERAPLRGIRFRQSSFAALQKAGQLNPKLRGCQLPDFIVLSSAPKQELTNINMRIMEYAVSGKSIVLKGFSEGYDVPLHIICGKDTQIEPTKLRYKDLPWKQQMNFSGEYCEKDGDIYHRIDGIDKTIRKETQELAK